MNNWKLTPGLALVALALCTQARAETVEVTARSLNVRTGPSSRYRVLRTVHKGSRYAVLSRSGSWVRMQVGSRRGWSYGRYLRTVRASTPAPKPATPKPAPKPNPAAPRQPADAPKATADQQLKGIQASALRVARAELARGVSESPLGSNRGTRVNVYARTAGFSPGYAWCGHFASFCYTTAAEARRSSWAGQRMLHSVGKARAFFLYYVYTERATRANKARWEATRSAHRKAGSMRRYMTLQGSVGDRAAGSRPHEVYARYQDLPLRPGDYVIWSRGGGNGHIGLVESYDRRSGRLTTIEGNTSNRVRRKTYDLSSASERRKLDGFGRPARGDFKK